MVLAPLHPEGWIGIKLDEILTVVKQNSDKLDALAMKLDTLETNLVTESKLINRKLDELIQDLEPAPAVGFKVTEQ